MDFSTISFPIIKNIKATSLSNDFKSVKPMTEKEAIAGRTVEEVEDKYDVFETIEDIKTVVINFLNEHEDNNHMLTVGHSSISHFGSDTIYYKPYSIYTITYQEHRISIFQDIVNDKRIARIDPSKFELAALEELINEIKQSRS